jgi:hypothetical protein
VWTPGSASRYSISGLHTGTETGPRERMYFATGFGLIQCVKALMSYEDDVRGPFLAKTRLTTVGW